MKPSEHTTKPWPAAILTASLLLLAGCAAPSNAFRDAPLLLEGRNVQEFQPGTHTVTFTVPENQRMFLVTTDGLKYLTGREP